MKRSGIWLSAGLYHIVWGAETCWTAAAPRGLLAPGLDPVQRVSAPARLYHIVNSSTPTE